MGTGRPAAVMSKPQSVTQPLTHSMATVISVKLSQNSAAQAGPQLPLQGWNLAPVPLSHLWRWASTARIVWEIGTAPLCFEARDLVTILAEREECSAVFSPGRWDGKEKGGCQKDSLSPKVLCCLLYSSFHFTQLSSFSTVTNAIMWKILVSTAGPFLQSPLHAGSLGQTPPSL